MIQTAAHLAGATLVYFGTGTEEPGKGIYVSTLDPATGSLSEAALAAEALRPGFLAMHPDGRHLYAIGLREPSPSSADGVVRAFAIDRATGRLSFLGDQTSGGPGPCHISLDRAGTFAFVANYAGGSASVIRILPDGRLGEPTARVAYTGSSVDPQRQTKPYAHSANLDPGGRFLFVADLGTDRIMIHRFDPRTGALAPNDPPFASVAPGSGPRHFAFHPNGRFAYVLNELANTVTVFRYDAARGALETVETLPTLPDGFHVAPNTSAEVVAHPNGRVLYTSNRGHDSIAVFAVDPETGRLTFLERTPTGGKTPRNFAIAPGGRWLVAANQGSDSVFVFAIDPRTGRLSRAGGPVAVPSPICVRFLVTE